MESQSVQKEFPKTAGDLSLSVPLTSFAEFKDQKNLLLLQDEP